MLTILVDKTNNNDIFGINKYCIPCFSISVVCLITFILCFFHPQASKTSEREANNLKVKKRIKNEHFQNKSNPEIDKHSNIEIKFTLSSSTQKKNSLVLFDNEGDSTAKEKNGKALEMSVCNLDTVTENEKVRNNIDNILDQDEYMEDFSVRFEKGKANKGSKSNENKNDGEDDKENKTINVSILQTNENFEKAGNLLTATNNSVTRNNNHNDSDFPKKENPDGILELENENYNEIADDETEKKEPNNLGNNKIEIDNNGESEKNGNRQSPKVVNGVQNIILSKEDSGDIHEINMKPTSLEKKSSQTDSEFLHNSQDINIKSFIISCFRTLVESSECSLLILFILFIYKLMNDDTNVLIKLLLILIAGNIIGTIIFFFVMKKLVVPSSELQDDNKKAIKTMLALTLGLIIVFTIIVSKFLGLDNLKIIIIISILYSIISITLKISLDSYNILKLNLQNKVKVKKIRTFELYITKPIKSLFGCITAIIFTQLVTDNEGDTGIIVIGVSNSLIIVLSFIFIYFIKT